MSLLQTISQSAAGAGLPFLVIGGYAVMAHGFVRATDDLDLLVQGCRREQWRQLLEGMGMRVLREASAFMQFDPPPSGRMQADAKPACAEGAGFGVVSLLHLIALKCHALHHTKHLRRLKDMEGVIQLITLNGLRLNDPQVRTIILKHGSQQLYERLQQACVPE